MAFLGKHRTVPSTFVGVLFMHIVMGVVLRFYTWGVVHPNIYPCWRSYRILLSMFSIASIALFFFFSHKNHLVQVCVHSF